MLIWLLPLFLVVAVVATMVSGIWLVLHLTALVRAFEGKGGLVQARVFPRVGRRAVRRVLAVFVGGAAATLVIVAVAATLPIH